MRTPNPTPHENLAEDFAKLAEAVDEQMKPVQSDDKAAELEKDPRDEERWSFSLKWTDRSGQHPYSGDFTNEILDIGKIQRSEVLRAKLCGNTPWQALDPGVRDLNEAIDKETKKLKARLDELKGY